MEINILVTLLNLVILLTTTWIANKRTKFQNVVDDSTAATNYHNLVINLQAEVKEARAEAKEVKDMLENLHLNLTLSLEMGKEPIIKAWSWIPSNPSPPT